MIGEYPVSKEVPLHEYLSRSGYFSFNRGQFVQAIIDNISSRMPDRNNENILKYMIALIRNKWPDDIDCPWLEGENSFNKREKVQLASQRNATSIPGICR